MNESSSLDLRPGKSWAARTAPGRLEDEPIRSGKDQRLPFANGPLVTSS